ncbi:MAG: hypothetical protein M3O07_09655 [Pseudomonadota bacterium]|nr:hypothetical protein [Pseudomonadota bacterium]
MRTLLSLSCAILLSTSASCRSRWRAATSQVRLATAILAWLAVSHHLVGLGVDY